MATEDKLLNGSGLSHLASKIKDELADKSQVSVSATGTATDEVGYITIDGVEKKLAGGGGTTYTAGQGITIDSNNTISNNLVPAISYGWIPLDDKFNWGYTDYAKEVTNGNVAQYIGKSPIIAGLTTTTPDLALYTDGWNPHSRNVVYKYDGTTFTYGSTQTDGTYTLTTNHVLVKVGRQNWLDCSNFTVFKKYMARIKYNNTNSGLTATNIPDAIDELVTKLPSEPIVDFTGADAVTAGEHGLVPAPAAGDNEKFLRGDGTWAEAGGGGSSYTFTNGLTESGGTVSWDLNDRIKAGLQHSINLGYASDGTIDSTGEGSLAGGFIQGGYSTSTITATSSAAIAYGFVNDRADIHAGAVGSLALGWCNSRSQNITASGGASIAQGFAPIEATKTAAVAIAGTGLKANSGYQLVHGKWNISDANDTYISIVGNGTADSTRSNAYSLDWSGNGHFAGDIYVGCASNSTGGTKLLRQTLNSTETTPTVNDQINWTYA